MKDTPPQHLSSTEIAPMLGSLLQLIWLMAFLISSTGQGGDQAFQQEIREMLLLAFNDVSLVLEQRGLRRGGEKERKDLYTFDFITMFPILEIKSAFSCKL